MAVYERSPGSLPSNAPALLAKGLAALSGILVVRAAAVAAFRKKSSCPLTFLLALRKELGFACPVRERLECGARHLGIFIFFWGLGPIGFSNATAPTFIAACLFP
jgi:hypothetical protein